MRRHRQEDCRSGRVLPGQAGRMGHGLAGAVALGVMAAAPTALGAERLAVRLAAAVKSLPRRAPRRPARAAARASSTTAPRPSAPCSPPAGGQLGQHFCTGSVVASPAGDLVITAAHCLAGQAGRGSVEFVPGIPPRPAAVRRLDGHPGLRGRGLVLLGAAPTTTWPSWSSPSPGTPARSRT